MIDQDLYNQIISNVPIACVDVAIKHKGRILLVKRKDAPAKGEWWLPGGRVLKGELMREAALRKAREEVGLDCTTHGIIHTDETLFPDGPYDIPIHSINSCFLLYPQNHKIRLDSHSSNYKWCEEDILDTQLHFYVFQCLKAAFKIDSSNPFKYI